MTTRILHVISSLRLGGAQTCLKAIAENLPKDEYEVYIFPLRSQKIDITIHAKILTCPYRNYDPRKFLALLRFCKEYRIDILHAHLEKPILAGLLASFIKPVKVIIHEHGPIFRPGWKHNIYRLLFRLFRSRVTSAIAVSQLSASQLEKQIKIPSDKIHVLYNPIDLNRFQNDPEIRQEIRTQLSLEDRKIVIGFLGRLSHIKAPELLLQTMPLLLEKSPDFHLVYLGDGPERSDLQNQTQTMNLANHVTFLGFQTEAVRYMNAFDLGLIPSRQDTFPMVALEYMAMNIPVICSGVQGLAELIENQMTGFITPSNTPQSIADCIIEALSEPQRLSRIKTSAYQRCRRFALPQYIQSMTSLYRQTMNPNVSQ